MGEGTSSCAQSVESMVSVVLFSDKMQRSICLLIAFVAFALLGGEVMELRGAESWNRAPAPIFPKALKLGDTVMIVAPAKYLDKERVSLAKKRLEEMGFKVKSQENLF